MMSPSFLAVSAATEAVAVANIDSPTELNGQAGVAIGDRKVAYQALANDNVYTVYYFDASDGSGASSPYVMAAASSGFWIAAGGKYNNSAVKLRSTLDVAGAGTFTSTLAVTGTVIGSSTVQGTQFISTIATGTAPLTVASTTAVTNLNASLLLGNTWAAPGAIGGTTPGSGAFTTVSATGVITSTLATGTAPFTVASTTVVGNLNVSQLLGSTWTAPGTIGSGTPNTGAFTTLSATGTSTLAAVNATSIGGTTPGTGAFTTLSATGTTTLGAFNATSIGATAPGTGAFTTLSASGITSITNATASTASNSGALVVSGGIGSAKDSVFGARVAVSASLTTLAMFAVAEGVASALGGANQQGVRSIITGNNSATSGIDAVVGFASSAAASFTCAVVAGGYFGIGSAGAGSTITRAVGVVAESPTAGTNNAALSIVAPGSSPAFTGSYAIRSESTNASLFSGSLSVSDTTDSTTSGTGSITTLGGLGVTKAVNIGTTLGVTGTSTFAVFNGTGASSVKISDAATATAPTAWTLSHTTSGTPVATFGVEVDHSLHSSTNALRVASAEVTQWVVATDASRTARRSLYAFDTAARECLRVEGTGSAAAIGFLGAAAVAQRGSTADLRQTIIDYGFLASGGATPLDLNGGTLTAKHTNIGGGSDLADAALGVSGFGGANAGTGSALQINAISNVGNTSLAIGAKILITTPASSGATAAVTGLYCQSNAPGSGSTITRSIGAWVDPQSGSTTNNCGIYLSTTNPPTYVGNYAIRCESTAQSTFAGQVLLTNPQGGFGYTDGSGGTVTQATSKATGVTLNTMCGLITMNAAALAANTSVAFSFGCGGIAASDFVFLQHDHTGTLGAYNICAVPTTGGATVTVRNITTGSLSEAIVLRFIVIKAATV